MRRNSNSSCLRAIFFIGASLMLTACASYPLGMSEGEWEGLSTEQQLSARERQADLDEARIQAQKERAISEREAYRQALSNAPYGTRVRCYIEGDVRTGGKWRRLDTTAFDALQGRSISVPLVTLDGRFKTKGAAVFDGYRVGLCDRQFGMERERSKCASVSGAPAELRRGRRSRVQADGFLRGEMACELPAPSAY